MKITQEQPKVEFKPITIVLETEFEAEVLLSLCGRVEGGGKVRKTTDELYSKLITILRAYESFFESNIRIRTEHQK